MESRYFDNSRWVSSREQTLAYIKVNPIFINGKNPFENVDVNSLTVKEMEKIIFSMLPLSDKQVIDDILNYSHDKGFIGISRTARDLESDLQLKKIRSDYTGSINAVLHIERYEIISYGICLGILETESSISLSSVTNKVIHEFAKEDTEKEVASLKKDSIWLLSEHNKELFNDSINVKNTEFGDINKIIKEEKIANKEGFRIGEDILVSSKEENTAAWFFEIITNLLNRGIKWRSAASNEDLGDINLSSSLETTIGNLFRNFNCTEAKKALEYASHQQKYHPSAKTTMLLIDLLAVIDGNLSSNQKNIYEERYPIKTLTRNIFYLDVMSETESETSDELLQDDKCIELQNIVSPTLEYSENMDFDEKDLLEMFNQAETEIVIALREKRKYQSVWLSSEIINQIETFKEQAVAYLKGPKNSSSGLKTTPQEIIVLSKCLISMAEVLNSGIIENNKPFLNKKMFDLCERNFNKVSTTIRNEQIKKILLISLLTISTLLLLTVCIASIVFSCGVATPAWLAGFSFATAGATAIATAVKVSGFTLLGIGLATSAVGTAITAKNIIPIHVVTKRKNSMVEAFENMSKTAMTLFKPEKKPDEIQKNNEPKKEQNVISI